MKQLLKYLGLVFVFIAVLLLIYEVKTGINDNSFLVISGALVIIGLVVHVVMNKQLE